MSFGLFHLVGRTVGLRVESDFEKHGLDRTEHANNAYPEFIPTDTLELAEL